MKLLRKKSSKSLFGIILLSVMLLKVCAFSISLFSSCADPLAVEKSIEEGKDTKEEPVDKKEKKLFSHIFLHTDHGQLIWLNHLPLSRYTYIMQIGSHPLMAVPTPPPDILV